MTQKEMLCAQLEAAYRSSPFHSFLASLQGVREEDALWLPPRYKGFPHMTGSILNLAFHVGGDKGVLVSHSFGDGAITWPRMQAHFEELGGNLAAAHRLAEEGHALVLDTLARQREEDLLAPRPYYGGKTYPACEIFSIIAEHDLYHAGQIHLLRNLIAGEKARYGSSREVVTRGQASARRNPSA